MLFAHTWVTYNGFYQVKLTNLQSMSRLCTNPNTLVCVYRRYSSAFLLPLTRVKLHAQREELKPRLAPKVSSNLDEYTWMFDESQSHCVQIA